MKKGGRTKGDSDRDRGATERREDTTVRRKGGHTEEFGLESVNA